MVNTISNLVSGIWNQKAFEFNEFSSKYRHTPEGRPIVPDDELHMASARQEVMKTLDRIYGYINGCTMQSVSFSSWTDNTRTIINLLGADGTITLKNFLKIIIEQCRQDRSNHSDEATRALNHLAKLAELLPEYIKIDTHLLNALNQWEETGILDLRSKEEIQAEPTQTTESAARLDLTRYSLVLNKLVQKLTDDVAGEVSLVAEIELNSIFNQLKQYIDKLSNDGYSNKTLLNASWGNFFQVFKKAKAAADLSAIQGRKPYNSDVMTGLELFIYHYGLHNYPVATSYRRLLEQVKDSKIEG